jgi:hypothetical protein
MSQLADMKLAFHFDGDHPDFGGAYGPAARRLVFSALLSQRHVHLTSKIFVGDLLFSDIDRSRDGRRRSFARADLSYSDILDFWLHPEHPVWLRLSEERLNSALGHRIYTICFESVDHALAEALHQRLVDASPYLGAMEVDDGSYIHWQLYSKKLIPKLRVIDRSAQVFWAGFSDDDKDPGFLDEVRGLGFDPVTWESLNGRYSIFDRYYNFEQAQRVAEWKRECGELLAFVADTVVSHLGDAVPDLGERLWSALRAFDQAATTEQLSHVAVSCRRIVEHVADRLFPPTETVTGGPKLGPAHYRNRLLAFADQARRNDTDIDLVCASTEALNEQITKLLAVAQKGIHAETYRTEMRRCLLRTIMLLDDFIALKRGAFAMRPGLDFGPFLPGRR